MKKKLFLLLVLLLPIMVNADTYPKVLTLDATLEDNVIDFSGTTENNSHAVMCKLINADSEEIDMLSVAVDSNAFEGTFIAPTIGNYTVSCANFEGGAIKTKNVTVTSTVTYTVTFNTNGGSSIQNATVDAGSTVQEPTAPTKEGFHFEGWYADSTLTTPFEFTTKITADTTIYAKWSEVEEEEPVVVHTVFFGEGGTYIVDFETEDSENQGPKGAPITNSGFYQVPAGNEMTLTAVPADGYRFKGWYRGNVNATTPEEWVTDEVLSRETVYRFVPTGYPYIVPVFETIGPHVVSFNTGDDEIHIDDIEIEHGGSLEMPELPARARYIFVGWYEDETLTTEFDPSTKITDDLTLYAKWEENVEEYEVSANGVTFTFTDEADHDFELQFIDVLALDEEEREALVPAEEYEQIYEMIVENTKKYGTLLSVYAIEIDDHGFSHEGETHIKIPMTKEMEKYNSFKIIYLDDENNFKVGEVIELEVNGDHLEGTLPHLSAYSLVGSYVAPSNNPKTNDSLYLWIGISLISIIGLSIGTIKLKKSEIR